MDEIFEKLFTILINGGIVLGIFVILLINNRGVRKTRANTFLSILLASLTFSTFHLRYAGDVVNHLSVRAYTFGDPTFLLIAPLLWFYVIELTGGRVKGFNNVHHFLPFGVIIFCSLTFNASLAESGAARFFGQHPRLPYTFFWMILVIQFSTYQYFIHKRWRNYQEIIQQEFSNTEEVSILWVRFFMIVFLIVNAVFLLSLFAAIHLNITNLIWKLAGIILSLTIFALGYKGILQKEIFSYITSEVPLPIQPAMRQRTKSDPDLSRKLLDFMEEKKPFLDPELSLSSLSSALGLNRNQLSQLINDSTGDNFYDFVNKYRIEEVKRLMVDPTKQNYNLLGIALEAGFKSKSTFNLIFKRFTGLTPTEYRRNIT